MTIHALRIPRDPLLPHTEDYNPIHALKVPKDPLKPSMEGYMTAEDVAKANEAAKPKPKAPLTMDPEIIEQVKRLLAPPRLLPPKPPLDLALLASQEAQVGLVEMDLKLNEFRLTKEKERKETFHKERLEQLKLAIEKAHESKGWEMFLKVAGWLGAVFTIGFGALAIATGIAAPAGIAMVVSGSVLLGTQIANELGAWDKLADHLTRNNRSEKAKVLDQIKLWTTLSTLLVSLGTVALGGTAVLQEGARVAATAIQAVTQVGSGIGNVGKAIVDHKGMHHRADSHRSKREIHRSKHSLDTILEANQANMDRWKSWMIHSTEVLESEQKINQAIFKNNARKGRSTAPAA